MTALDILTAWAKYTNYDPDQKRFNLLSSEYELHRCNKRIEHLTTGYDPTGTLAMIYAKNTFLNLLKESKVHLYDVVANPEDFQETRDMWTLFTSKEVTMVEDSYLDGMNKLLQQVTGQKMLGTRDKEAEKETLFSAVDAVVAELDGCNVDLFLRGGPVQPVTNFSTHIHVFPRLATCLLALESAKDGIYLCYVSDNDSAGGYFGFYIKSNGNLLSINERPNEAYAGQHKNCRNAHWTEDKKYRMFPYEYMFSFGDADYKGYYTKHIIDQEKLAFLNLTPDAYFPLILGMVMLTQKYAGCTLDDLPLKYTDSLLPVNILSPATEEMALTVPTGSQLALTHKELVLDFTPENVLDGSLAARFDSASNRTHHYTETGTFKNYNQLLVDLYGKGFTFDASTLLEANQHLKLTDGSQKEDLTPNSEFVGTQIRMEMQAYINVRQALAEYMRDRIYEEYMTFGGIGAVKAWWRKKLDEHRETIYQLATQRYKAIASGEATTPPPGWESSSDGLLNRINYMEKDYLPFDEGVSLEFILNKRVGSIIQGDYRDPINGARVSHFFVFKLRNWKEMEELLGEEVPKILKGWQRDGHSTSGNPILNATDPVDAVGTPFENYQSANERYTKHYTGRTSCYGPAAFNFKFAIGFSKSGLKKLLREEKK